MSICPHLTVAACDCAGKGSGRYLGRRPFADDIQGAQANYREVICGDDFAANGLCVRAKGHAGFHQDAHGHAWRPVSAADSDGERRDINGAFILATYSDGREVHLYGRRNGFAYAAFADDLGCVFKVPSHWVTG